MRYTLKDYQADAVGRVLTNLRKARRYYHDDGDRSQFSLSATTGAGKTVMAAAVIEALFYGSDEFDFEPDPGAVVVWFSDDPSLNEQSRARLRAASDKLDRMVPVQTTFNHLKFNPQTVYFLNTQKFSKHSLLVRGANTEMDNDQELLVASRPDEQQNSIWDTITNTIEDESFTLYFILDEAHRGMGTRNRERPTIVKRLINGHGTVPPLPIVWGISATVERFENAMRDMVGRTALPSVDVDSARVQASGLLKDDIVLGFPAESGRFDTVLLKRAVRKVVESTYAWAEYSRSQGDPETVVPLLVVQVPDKASNQMLADAVATIYGEWPSTLPALEYAFANVFGEHKDLTIGQTTIPYIAPERVQDAPNIRVLFAKNAISTGWDCPRAEVMMSFRPAKDMTHITQLLGRMVRTPLARRIPGIETLNSVYCLLPFFDHKTATTVADRLMKGSTDRDDDENMTGTGGGEGRRILFAPAEMIPNPEIPDSVWECFLTLPSETIPRNNAKPIKRLTALAQALSIDNLIDHAGDNAHKYLHSVLDGLAARYKSEVESAIRDIQTVAGENLRVNMVERGVTNDEFTEVADNRSIEDAYRAARRAFSDDVTRTYAEYLAGEGADDDDLRDAHVKVAALARIPEIVTEVESEAEKLATKWFGQTRVERTRLNDRKQAEYDDIQAMSSNPQRISLDRPKVRQEDTKIRDGKGNEMPLPTRTNHLLADSTGVFPIRLNDWETTVLDTEMARPGFCAWYRNPSRVCKEALSISYEPRPGEYLPFCPDFIFFVQMDDGRIVADLVDPHGFYLADALPKLRGLARFAETYDNDFHRIEAIAKVGEKLRVLDLTKPDVIKAVKECVNLENLYMSEHAQDYC